MTPARTRIVSRRGLLRSTPAVAIALRSMDVGRARALDGSSSASVLWRSAESQFLPGDRLRDLDFSPFATVMRHLTAARSAEIDQLVLRSTIADLQTAFATGTLTSVELTTYFLKRIQAYDGTLRGFIELNPNALDEARFADLSRVSGMARGPLHGIPISIKDNIETAGPMRTTAGAAVLMDNVASSDAALVARLRSAGAVILGKASLSEFAGVVTNPGVNAVSGQGINGYCSWLPVLGSSSGSSIAVSAYLAAASVGTETAGSLIAPGFANGVVAMKPSAGLIEPDGVIPLVSSNDSAGPIGRSVADVAAMLTAIAGSRVDFDAGLTPWAFHGRVAGVLTAGILAEADENAELLARIAAGLDRAGAIVRDAPLTPIDGLGDDFTVLMLSGFACETMSYLRKVGAPATTVEQLIAYNQEFPSIRIPQGEPMIEEAAYLALPRGSYHRQIAEMKASLVVALESAFSRANADVLVSLENIHSLYYATAGYPAITVPLGFRPSGTPTGVTFIGRHGDDGQLLACAHAFQVATQLRVETNLFGDVSIPIC